MQTDGAITVVTLPLGPSSLQKLRIKKRTLLDNKLAQFSEGLYFTDIPTDGLLNFSKRIKKPDGLTTFNRLIPEIALKVIKRQGRDVQNAKVAVVAENCDAETFSRLSDRFRFITAIGSDDALWDNIYEETGLSIPFLNEEAAKRADLVIYTGRENKYLPTKGISIGFDAEGEGTIGKNSLSFCAGSGFSKLEEYLKRPLTIGEIEAIGCPYKYHLYM